MSVASVSVQVGTISLWIMVTVCIALSGVTV